MRTTEERFWQKVNKTDSCWLFTGAHNGTGYCVIRANGKSTYVHRYSHELHKGQIPEGLQIDHLCRVRNCVNPAHLEAVTFEENMRRTIKCDKTCEPEDCYRCKIAKRPKKVVVQKPRGVCEIEGCDNPQPAAYIHKGATYWRKKCYTDGHWKQ